MIVCFFVDRLLPSIDRWLEEGERKKTCFMLLRNKVNSYHASSLRGMGSGWLFLTKDRDGLFRCGPSITADRCLGAGERKENVFCIEAHKTRFRFLFLSPTQGRGWLLRAVGRPSQLMNGLEQKREKENKKVCLCPAPCHPSAVMNGPQREESSRSFTRRSQPEPSQMNQTELTNKSNFARKRLHTLQQDKGSVSRTLKVLTTDAL